MAHSTRVQAQLQAYLEPPILQEWPSGGDAGPQTPVYADECEESKCSEVGKCAPGTDIERSKVVNA
jgi:hypothetical protein